MNREECDSLQPLRLRFFGAFEGFRGKVPLARARTRKDIWLLGLLTLHHDQPVDRSWLAGTLWPDASEQQALAYLRTSLYVLRRLLGRDADRLEAPTPRALRLNLTGAVVDVLEFDRLMALGDCSSLEAAVAMYRGALLDDCAEEWARVPRETRRDSFLTALETLARRRMEAGRPDEAARFLHRALGVDPFREQIHRAMLKSLASAGDYSGLDRHYRELRRAFLGEMNIEPSAETRVLYESLRAARQVPVSPSPSPAATRRLPCPLAPLIGRSREVAEITGLLATARLTTLTGTGGVGKTRIAIASAEKACGDFEHGAWFVDLASVADCEAVPAAVARALEVREERDRPLRQTLLEFVQERRLLLVLDNCEHVVNGAAALTLDILESARGVRILATSRQALAVPGEVVRQIAPLAPPSSSELEADPDVERLLESPAARLFIDRAAAAAAGFRLQPRHCRAVARICCLLDGLPLALELAAVWVRRVSLDEIVARLNEGLDFQGERTRASRHRSLHAMLDWTYQVLDPELARLLRRLAVFSGGWTADAAAAVAGRSGSDTLLALADLVDQSFVIFPAGESQDRYSLLETTRQYLLEKLAESGDEQEARGLHLRYFTDLASRATAQLRTREQSVWLPLLEADLDNFRAALRFGIACPSAAEEGLRLAAALERFWKIRGRLTEGRRYLAELMAVAAGPPALMADAHVSAGLLAYGLGDRAAAGEHFKTARNLAEKLGDVSLLARTLHGLGMVEYEEGQFTAARQLDEEALALFRKVDDRPAVGAVLCSLADVARQMGDWDSARRCLYESLEIHEEIGNAAGIGTNLLLIALIAQGEDSAATAIDCCKRSMALYRSIDDRLGLSVAAFQFGNILIQQGALEAAEPVLHDGLSIAREYGNRLFVVEILVALGSLEQARGGKAKAREYRSEALRSVQGTANLMAQARGVEQMAVQSHFEQRPALAAMLLGALSSNCPDYAASTRNAGRLEQLKQEIRNLAGEESFSAAWARGVSALWPEAMHEALQTQE